MQFTQGSLCKRSSYAEIVWPCGLWRSTRRILAVVAALLLGLAFGARPTLSQASQDFLAANVDSTVSPRDDFFHYANGGWFKRHPLPDDAGRWGTWNVVLQDIDARLQQINENAARSVWPKGSPEQLIGDFWFTGMDSVSINRQGLAPLRPDLDAIDRIRSVDDVVEFVAVLHRRDQFLFSSSARVAFFGHVERDEKNRDRRILSLRQSGITMLSPADYSSGDTRRVKQQQALRECLFNTFRRLQDDSGKARARADGVYGFEAEIARAFENTNDYRVVDVAELARLAPSIQWRRYFQRIGAGEVDSVDIRNPHYFQSLDSLLHSVPVDTWKDYLRFWLIKVNSSFLDDSTFRLFWDYNRAFSGALRPRPRWQRVLAQERNVGLTQLLATLFEKNYALTNAKTREYAIAESMRAAFRDRIARLDWMSESTKSSAFAKLASLKITIGVPETSIDYRTMPLRRDAYVYNVIRASTWFHDRDMRMLHQRVDRGSSDQRPIFSDASYDDASNEIRFGPASLIIAPGVRSDDVDDAVAYGASPMGHEISHAFDSEGRHYDARGNKVDWWTASDDSAFRRRAQVIIDEYSEFMPIEGVHVNGQRSLRENMADFVGLRVALDAFKKTEQYRRNEKIGGFTPLQRFFLAYAYSNGAVERPESLANRLRIAEYAPDRERVNGVLVNIPEFYEAFGVKPGDRMYRPDSARVKIW